MTSMRSIALCTIGVMLFALVPATLVAQTSDVVEVASGDRISGDVSRLAHGQLAFRTASAGTGRPRFAGTISIAWTEVVRLTSAKQLDVELASGERFSGSVSSPSPGRLIVQTATGPSRLLEITDIVGIIPIEAGFRGRTTGSIDFGLNFTTAENARTYTLDAAALHHSRGYNYETEVNFDSWLSGQDDGERVTRNNLNTDVRRRLSNRWFAVATGAVQQDEPFDLHARLLAGGGIGRRLIQTNRGIFSVEGGLDYDAEKYGDREAFDHSGEVFAGVAGDWFAAGGSTEASVAARTFISLARRRTRLELDSSLRRDLALNLYWAFNIEESFDSDPPRDRPRSDLGLSFSLGWTF
jgi:hypothetical protein